MQVLRSAETAWLTATVPGRDRRAGDQRGPCVLVVRDRGGAVFGCFTAEAWRVAPRYYGTGESFVFKLQVLEQSICFVQGVCCYRESQGTAMRRVCKQQACNLVPLLSETATV